MFKKSLLALAIATTALSLAACNDKEAVTEPVVEPETTTEVVTEPEVVAEPTAEAAPMEAAATQSIGEIAAANPDLSILTAALKAAGLDTMMMDAGTYTVFAPTDSAFAPVLEKLGVTKEELLANTELLKKVLPYHVIPSVVKAADIPYGTDVATVNGATINISDANVITDAAGGTATITGTDIMATNGVVHTIDAVLMPE